MLKNKKILISGAGGSIGSELVRQLAVNNKVYGFDLNETAMYMVHEEQRNKGNPIRSRPGDIRNVTTLDEIFHAFRPDIVFHAAAYKNVTPMEHTPKEAAENNIIGTINMVMMAKRYRVNTFVNISTDKAVNPKCIMGISKYFTEAVVKNAGYISVRFGNVLASRGSVLDYWALQHAKGEPLTITDVRMERFFMTIPQACALVIQAVKIGKRGDKVLFNMGELRNIMDLKRELYGEDYPVKIIGIRPGEVLTETLYTEEEAKRLVRRGKFLIIR